MSAALEALGSASKGSAPDHSRVNRLRIQLTAHALGGNHRDAERVFDEILQEESVPDLGGALCLMVEIVQVGLMAGISAERLRQDFVDGWAVHHVLHDRLDRIAEGLLASATGNHHAALTAFDLVFDDLDPTLSIPTVASLRTERAVALLGAGDRLGALDSARRVVAELSSWPGRRRDRAQALVRRLEGSGARIDGDLTAREREVAALVSAGVTNSALAERLFISPRTAAVHVSNILMKLGLSSRAEIAAWAVRQETTLQVG